MPFLALHSLSAHVFLYAVTTLLCGALVIAVHVCRSNLVVLGEPQIGPEVVADLKKLKAQQAKEQLSLGAVYNPANLVVVNEDGTPVRPETYSELFDRHTKTAGLPRIRLHDLRHTTASLLAAAGVPVVDASAMLGHDPVVFQRIYAHALEEGLRKAGGVLAGLYAVGQ